jgi:hypothetical protein
MELSVFRYQSRAVMADCRRDDLIGGVSGEWGRELAGFDQNSGRQLGHVKTLNADRKVQPVSKRAIQN